VTPGPVGKPSGSDRRPSDDSLASRRRLLFGGPAIRDDAGNLEYRISEDPELVPPPLLMLEEADEVLEDWFSGGAEQATLVRLLANVGSDSRVLEIGCGLGRLASALRRVLTDGEYVGVDVVEHKIAFLSNRLTTRAPQFKFSHLNVANAMYNPAGEIGSDDVSLPCADDWADATVAMAVLTHLLPNALDSYLEEIARVLRPGGRFIASLYILDYYESTRRRPDRYSLPEFSFEYPVADAPGFRTSDADCPERMLAIQLDHLTKRANRYGLTLFERPRPGSWSGITDGWTTGQDLVVFEAADSD
jgi:SAM-dependent methyltransferase